MLVTGRPLIESVHRAWWTTVDRIGDPAAVDRSTTTDVLSATEFSRLMHPARHGEGAHPELISLDEHLRHVVAAALQLAGIAGEGDGEVCCAAEIHGLEASCQRLRSAS